MKHLWMPLALGICLFSCSAGLAAELPQGYDDFSHLIDQQAREAEGGVRVFFTAVSAVLHGDPTTGERMMDAIMSPAGWGAGQPILAAALAGSPWVFESYDSTPGATLIEPTVERVDIINVPTLGVGQLARAMVHTSASPTARPVYLRQVGATWKVALATPLCIGLSHPTRETTSDIPGTEDPSGALHLLLEGAYLYTLGDADEGENLLRASMVSDPGDPEIAMCLDYARRQPYIFYSYAQGTHPDDGYTSFDPFSFGVEITSMQVEDADTVRAFVASSGADTPRPFTCSINVRNQCRVHVYSSLYVGVRHPPESMLAWPAEPGHGVVGAPTGQRRVSAR